jgi:hypothetical protein
MLFMLDSLYYLGMMICRCDGSTYIHNGHPRLQATSPPSTRSQTYLSKK